MNKRLICILLATIGLAGCSSAKVEVKAEELPNEAPVAETPTRAPDPDLKSWLTGQNVEGYTKKTVINPEFCSAHKDWFHAGCNGSERATYYNKEETALLMGDYGGGFEHINSGYRNNDDGIQHFTHDNEKENKTDIFLDVIDDWTYPDQKVGVYYPTLTLLSSHINQEEDWTYDSVKNTFSYFKDDATLFHDFQFFAAPMLLEGYVTWNTVEIEMKGEILEIRLVDDDSHTIISVASIEQGY